MAGRVDERRSTPIGHHAGGGRSGVDGESGEGYDLPDEVGVIIGETEE